MNVLTMDQIRQTAPSVFASQPFEGMSHRYRFIPTSSVIDSLRDRGFVPVRATQSRARSAEKKEYTKHMIRFRRMNDLMVDREAKVPEIVLTNSHDGTSGYVLMLGIFRVICSNGLVVASSTVNEIRVRHTGSPDLAREVADASWDVIKEAPRVIEGINDWDRILLTAEQQLAYAESAKLIRESSVDVEARSLLNIRRYADEKPTLWNTFNVVQENILKGGSRGRNTKGNRVHTRAIKSVSEDLRLNRALWQLTEKMQELITKN